MIMYSLKKNGGELGACRVEVLRESRGPVYDTKGFINSIEVCLVVKPDLSARLTAERRGFRKK